MASLPGHATPKAGCTSATVYSSSPSTHNQLIQNCYNEVLTRFPKFSSIILNCYNAQVWHGNTFNHIL